MDLPIPYDEALEEWDRFEQYLVQARYSVRDPKTGLPMEEDFAKVLARVCSQFSHPGVAKALAHGQIITATPFLMNGGNTYTSRRGFYSCYPLGDVGDSTKEIFEMELDLVTIFQHAGGGGIDVSNLRPRGTIVDHGQGTASGPVSFAKGFSHLSDRISQGGKRRGALMIQANYDIKDIQDFITFKGDNPGKYTGCNVSVNVTDEKFWDDEPLLQTISEYIWKSGDPGLLFTQKSLANTPVLAKYNPVFSNPCGEYLSTKDTACNLLTVSLPKCLDEQREVFLVNVFEAARLAAIAGNEILDMGGFPPIERIKNNTLKFRPIGIGFTGLHHAMNHFDVSYADEHEAPRFAKATQLALMLGSMQGSLDYGESEAKKNRKLTPQEWNMSYVDKIHTEAVAFIKTDFVDNKEWQKRLEHVFTKLRKLGGLYNSVTTSQAPTGSISQLMRVACTGVEPYFSMVQTRKVKDIDESWKEFTLVPLEFYGYTKEKVAWVKTQTAHEIDPHQQIRILEACQAFNHTAVSKTINLPADTTVADIRAFLDYARKSNLKGITMFRDSSMEGVLSDKHSGHGCTEAPAVSEFTDLDERHGSTFKWRGPAPLYITANRGNNGHIRELFLNTTKSGSTLHGMSEALGRVISVALQHDYRLVGKIARTLEDISSDGAWNNGSLGRVYSIPAALAKVLDRCAETEVDSDDPAPYVEPSSYSSCPVCGKLSLRRSGGCNSCVSCGYSSC
jgi:ribonucleoside-diphosphate reductase alpha chain